MQAQPSTLVRWKERWLFAAVAVVLVGYVGLWVLAHATGPDVGSAQPVAKQTYARASEPEPLPERGTEIFASGELARYWDETRRLIWVEPKEKVVEREIKPAKLTPPPSTVPAPPMLLPLPGPAL
ncbi:MAG: hypothetical protein ACYSU0_12765, partial [Planctomycetota bacterium]